MPAEDLYGQKAIDSEPVESDFEISWCPGHKTAIYELTLVSEVLLRSIWLLEIRRNFL